MNQKKETKPKCERCRKLTADGIIVCVECKNELEKLDYPQRMI